MTQFAELASMSAERAEPQEAMSAELAEPEEAMSAANATGQAEDAELALQRKTDELEQEQQAYLTDLAAAEKALEQVPDGDHAQHYRALKGMFDLKANHCITAGRILIDIIEIAKPGNKSVTTHDGKRSYYLTLDECRTTFNLAEKNLADNNAHEFHPFWKARYETFVLVPSNHQPALLYRCPVGSD